MTYPLNVDLNFVYKYDFAVDGGAVSTIPLTIKDGVNLLEAGLVIEEVQVYVQTAFTSGGSATVTLGNSVDDDGFLVDFFALASAGAAIRGGQIAGALIWDNTNDNELSYAIPSAAASIPKIKIGTAALTAGAMEVHIKARKYV